MNEDKIIKKKLSLGKLSIDFSNLVIFCQRVVLSRNLKLGISV